MKKLNKAISLILSVIMVLSLVPVTVNAAIKSGKCGENVRWTFDETTGLLTISGTGEMTEFDYYNTRGWPEDLIREVVVNEGVTSISRRAFVGCSSLEQFVAGNSLTTIGNSAFENCNRLRSVIIGDGIETIGDRAFYDLDSLETVIIGNGSVKIGEKAFYDCDDLGYSIGFGAFESNGYVIIGSNTPGDNSGIIGKSAFEHCDSLYNLVLGEGISEIHENAFLQGYICHSITMCLPDSVKKIEYGAFAGCWIVKLKLGKSVSSVDLRKPLFYSSPSCFLVDSENPYFSNDDKEVLFNKDKTTLIYYPGTSYDTEYVVPDTVTTIAEKAFYSALNELEKIVLPEGLITIGKSAFYSCDGLNDISIPDSVTSIGNSAFSGCDNLSDISIPDGVTTISDYTFSGCANLSDISIPDSVTSIGNSAFSGCANLSDISIPDSVTSIGNYAFRGCTGLTDIPIPDSVTTISDYAFSECANLSDISIPVSVTSIGSRIFYNSEKFKHIYYEGDEEQWNAISFQSSNDELFNAKVHFNCRKVAFAPTCTEHGSIKYTCDCCGVYNTDYISNPTGHSINADGVCENCGMQEEVNNTASNNQLLSFDGILQMIINLIFKMFDTIMAV